MMGFHSPKSHGQKMVNIFMGIPRMKIVYAYGEYHVWITYVQIKMYVQM